LDGVTMTINMMEKNPNQRRKEDGKVSKYGVYSPRYFQLLSSMWETEPQPIKACLREVREEENKPSITFIRGYCGAWKAVNKHSKKQRNTGVSGHGSSI